MDARGAEATSTNFQPDSAMDSPCPTTSSGASNANEIPSNSRISPLTLSSPLETPSIAPKESSSRKLSRKRKEEIKKLRNEGKTYISSNDKLVPARAMTTLGACRMKCNQKVSETQRERCFKNYWELGTRDRRVSYIASLVELAPKNSQKLGQVIVRRNFLCRYFLIVENAKICVCKSCFCKTFGETLGFVDRAVESMKRSTTGTISPDKRGKSSPPNKLTESKLKEIEWHINKFPAYESHYSRKRSSKKYLSSDLTIAKMYDLYSKEVEKPASIKIYSKIFNDLNLSFKKPAKDTCHKCDLFQIQIETNSDNELIKQRDSHHAMAEDAYESKRLDKIRSKECPSVMVLAFDLQQCLPTPSLKTSVSFYKRQLWSFNLTIHNLGNDASYCYMWDETISGRGANQIASCLFKFLKTIPESVEEIIFYSDTCGGQNKNNIVSIMFLYTLEYSKILPASIKTITHKFMISGHSHMECDSDHALIEKEKKRTSMKINHLNDWMQLVRMVKRRHSFNVVEMMQEDFINFCGLSKKNGPYSIKKKDETGNKFLWKNVQSLQYRRVSPSIIFFQTDLKGTFNSINFKKSGNVSENNISIMLRPITLKKVPISAEKKKDLMDLLPMIDSHYHEFYKNLKVESRKSLSNNIDPDLEGFDADGDDED